MWTEWSDPPGREWDAALAASPDGTVFQSHGWGEFKRLSRWIPKRWVARDSRGVIVGMAQILTRMVPGVMVGWAPGGPVFNFQDQTGRKPDELLLALLEALKGAYRRCYVRVDHYGAADSAVAEALSRRLVRPSMSVNTGFSVHIDLRQSLDDVMQRMTAKHRYYVKKALKVNLEWRAGHDDDSREALVRLHDEMLRAKQLDGLKKHPGEIRNLLQALGSRALIFTGYDGGIPVTTCLVLLFERNAFYWMAATGAQGRESSAAYAMAYKLFEYLQAQGIRHFNFGGIAPGAAATEGVNHFKRGFGGKIVRQAGEWEWSNAWWLRAGVNLAVRYRGSHL
jgi:lipid II:glycine glycyltransferase (peptidoglycan interpeptide bridge formation enzyme)